MPLLFAELLVALLSTYATVGALVALLFVWRGVQRVDPRAAGASLSFRVLILPGAVLFWPLLLVRWASGSIAPPDELNAHRRRAGRRT